jgi:DNA-binding beta-propeller fold protein YncE
VSGVRHRPLLLAGALAGCLWLLVSLGCSSGSRAQGTTAAAGKPSTPAPATGGAAATVHHYEYVFPDGSIYVYDMDAGHRLVAHMEVPTARGIRGVVASPRTHTLYISFGGDGGGNGNGSILAYDLLAGHVLWQRSYSTGIDSMAISPDGGRIYMPTGELSSGGTWLVLDGRDGHVITTIQGGNGPHNTVMSLSGRHVYLGGRAHEYLEVADTRTNRVFRNIGPLRNTVRPFTINGRETLAYTTATGHIGFQVSSIASGRVLYTANAPGFGFNPSKFGLSAPSHGISLAPNERQVWVIDAPNSYVHVFDVSHVPAAAPKLIANIALTHPMTGEENPCKYDCGRDGWLQHSRNGRFVYVGDSGDVIDTRTLRPVAYLPTLRQTRKMLEIDWRGGLPIATTSRSGVGYVR